MSAASGALVAGNFPTLKTRHVLSRQNDEHVDGRANLMIEQFAGYRRMRTQNQVQMKAVRTVAICYSIPRSVCADPLEPSEYEYEYVRNRRLVPPHLLHDEVALIYSDEMMN